MSINLSVLLQTAVVLLFWCSCFAGTAYYIDRAMPKIAKKSAIIATLLCLIPVFGFAYLIYLYLTAKRRLVVSF